MWNAGWDRIFTDNEWGKYPEVELIRFVGRTFYSAADRRAVKFLEVGSGTGANLWYLGREGFDVYGIDGSAVGVERAGKRLAAENVPATVTVGDAMHLPYDDNTFDCVIDNECIYANDLADSKTIIAEIHRVLKPGGRFFSKTFMAGMSGDGEGEKKPGEPNTYTRFDGPLHEGYGIVRLTAEDEIPGLYAPFRIDSVDVVSRTDKNRSVTIKEWIILMTKEA